MIDTALYFLYRTAKRVPHNQYAKAIYNRFKNSGGLFDEFEHNLLEIPFGDETVLDEKNVVTIERGRDYRFLYLYFKSFRKFPKPDKGYYGIPFCKVKGEKEFFPENTLLLGSNGTGKTSVFGALEYVFTGHISAAEKMGFLTKEDMEDYIPFAGQSYKDAEINVLTCSMLVNGTLDDARRRDISHLCLLPFFCSELDVDKVTDSTLDDFVFEQMGYSLIRRVIGSVEKELKEALKQYEAREESLESVVSRVDDYDIQIRMHDLIWSSFSPILTKICDKQDLKKKSQTSVLSVSLSDELVMEDESNGLVNVKTLTLDNLNAEIDSVSQVLGKRKNVKTAMQPYIKAKELLDPDTNHPEPLLKPSMSKPDNHSEVLRELNCYRKTLKEMIDVCMKSDIKSMIEWKNDVLNRLNRERQDAQDIRVAYEKIDRIVLNKGVYEEFLNTIKKEVFDRVDVITKGSRELVNNVMSVFLMNDERMSMEFNRETGQFKMIVEFIAEKKKVFFTPEKYLNSFRYKLFCMTLKMAIAFAMKKFYRINFPIVIDDVFYSSDFTHRGKVRDFFGLLFDKHKELFPDEELQVILLTHDEVVLDAAYRGINDVLGCNGASRQVMFDYREADEQQKLTLPVEIVNANPITVETYKLTLS